MTLSGYDAVNQGVLSVARDLVGEDREGFPGWFG